MPQQTPSAGCRAGAARGGRGGSEGLAGALRREHAKAWRGLGPLRTGVLQHALVRTHTLQHALVRARTHVAACTHVRTHRSMHTHTCCSTHGHAHTLQHAHVRTEVAACAHSLVAARTRVHAQRRCCGTPVPMCCPSSRHWSGRKVNRCSALPAGKAEQALGDSGAATAPIYWSYNAAGTGFASPRPPRFPTWGPQGRCGAPRPEPGRPRADQGMTGDGAEPLAQLMPSAGL